MKNIIILATLALAGWFHAQVAIGKTTLTNSSVALEFGTDVRGIRLPVVTDVSAMTGTNGSMVFDAATGSFRFYANNVWSTATAGGQTGGAPTGADTGNGVIIGANSSSATGALIIESSDKALVLPRAVLIDQRTITGVKGLAMWDSAMKAVVVYDGAKWNYY
ncbi:hypothetical protein [Chryseobacterium cheonjiense]|uniref:Uncharacterized protein n=1 Tax=Chryseobacterium cheonjiense TaxID=2728845 RepID=A0A7Y0A9X0_9FLAO|nr:hypothetical protein [Chryseobacterium cheonjiense]NML59385.1 hypothetical protein [Chryseobacterium cheonjiense]